MTSSKNNFPLRTALVTGGAKRVGAAIAEGLARAGWNVAITYSNSSAEAEQTAAHLKTFGVNACAIEQSFDALTAKSAEQLLAKCTERLGTVTCLINSAANFHFDSGHELDTAVFERSLKVNTLAPILLTQALYKSLIDDTRGVAVNMLDQKLFNLNPDFFSYTLSKSALHCATTLLAKALAPKLRVIGVAPGLTLASPYQSDEEYEQTHKLSPLGCSSVLADVVETVCFAVKNHSITGTTLLVDGGQHLIKFERDFSYMGGALNG